MIQRTIPLQLLNSYLVDAHADYYYHYDTDRELSEILSWAHRSQLPIHILGGGTNVLLKTPLIKGLIIHMAAYGYSITNTTISVGSGVDSALFSLLARNHSLTGAEFLYALPGSIGGAIYMNARAFDRSISDIILSARIMDHTGKIVTLQADDMAFAYKDSFFQHNPGIILSADFKLDHGDKENIDSLMTENIQGRRSRGHFDYPSCGSVFKNPYDVGIPAGKLIETSGLKGKSIGDAKVFEKHANFIINNGNASGDDIAQLIIFVQKTVESQHHVNLTPEVCFWD